MTLQQLLYFKTIAEKKSYTRASQTLYVTQPALSYAIQSLERELDIPLFTRKAGKDVNLSIYGYALLPYVEQVLHILDDGIDNISTLTCHARDVVKIMLSHASSFSYILNMLKSFSDDEDHKNISLQIQVSYSRTSALKFLSSGDIDLAFFGSVDSADEDGTASVPVASEALSVLLPLNHPLANKAKLTLRDIAQEPLYIFERNTLFSKWLHQTFNDNGIVPDVVGEANNWSSLIAAIALGDGIAISPEITIDKSLIAAIPLHCNSKHSWRTHIFWPANHKLSAAAQYVKCYCVKYSEQVSH